MATTTNHSRKVNRAMQLAAIGNYPESRSAMLRALPESAIAQLTARGLADMLDAAWQLASASKAIADGDAIAEGGVWDARAQRFRELAR